MGMKIHPPAGATKRSRHLRTNPTEAEKRMWYLLRHYFPEARFRRQVPFRRFIADFASHPARLVIEVDGGQHGGPNDAARTAVIEADGYKVIRFWNNDILGNSDGVVMLIGEALEERKPLTRRRRRSPPLDGEGWEG